MPPTIDLDIRRDDLRGGPTRALIAAHLAGMHATSPAESVHALDADGLGGRDVSFWSAWSEGELAGVGALKEFGDRRGELKSMRVADAYLGRGVGRRILRHIIEQARQRRLTSLWLETGTPEDFIPAQRLYASEGFTVCEPFGDYTLDPYSVFMTRTL